MMPTSQPDILSPSSSHAQSDVQAEEGVQSILSNQVLCRRRGGRDLLLDGRSLEASLSGLAFFVAPGLHRLSWWLRLWLGRFCVRMRGLERVSVNLNHPIIALIPFLRNSLRSARFDVDWKASAFAMGSQGPYQKLSAWLKISSAPVNASPNPQIDGVRGGVDQRAKYPNTAVLKLAMQATADPLVQFEGEWLRRFATLPSLAAFVPRYLGHGELNSGRRWVLMSVLPPGQVDPHFGLMHERFLQAMLEASAIMSMPIRDVDKIGLSIGVEQSWWDSLTDSSKALLWSPCEWLSRLAHSPEHEFLKRCLLQIANRLRTHSLPLALVHGDFAPWNIRLTKTSPQVFDWEYAREQGSPLHDFYHFYFVRMALVRRFGFWRANRRRDFEHVVETAKAYATRQFGGASAVVSCAEALADLYLIDTILFFANSTGAIDLHHPVTATYWGWLHRDRSQSSF